MSSLHPEADGVSAYVRQMEEAERIDASEAGRLARMIQGALLISVESETRPLSEMIQIDHVEQLYNEDGIYEKHFVVVTRSGLRIRVTVEPEVADE